jgi:hypothetical protein
LELALTRLCLRIRLQGAIVPLSSDPERRERQLANLKRGANPVTPKGEPSTALNHGGRSKLLYRDVGAEVYELMDALGEAVPVRNADGSVPAADIAAIEYAARALKRYRHLSTWCDAHGRIEEKTGDVKSAAQYELQAERSLAAALDALGMTPTSRAKLGLDLQRTAASAEELEAARTARERLDSRAETIEAEAIE